MNQIDNMSDRTAARMKLGISGEAQVIFILGGSQGAEPINRHIERHFEWYASRENTILLWQCGAKNIDKYRRYDGMGAIRVFGFIDDMSTVYAASDIIVARAGALTLAELAIVAKPAVLIPLPSAAANHQYHNAMSYAESGAAVVLKQPELSSGILEETINAILASPEQQQRMREAARFQAHPEATRHIVEAIYTVAGKKSDVQEV